MSDDQFTQLFKLISNLADKMATKDDVAKLATQIDSVYRLLDQNIGEHQTQEQERAAMNHQLDRHEQWIHQLADQNGATLHYE